MENLQEFQEVKDVIDAFMAKGNKVERFKEITQYLNDNYSVK